MTNKIFILASAMAVCASASAQDSYDAANFATGDLNGTARYVGMGGALGALGGDISVMSSNPAGTAMYKKADAAFTFSAVIGNSGVLGHDGTRMSIDNGGAVFAWNIDDDDSPIKYVNFGINYTKHKNFLYNMDSYVDNLYDASGSPYYSQTYQIGNMANTALNVNAFDNRNYAAGALPTMATTVGNQTEYGLLWETYNESTDELVGFNGVAAQDAALRKSTYGGIDEADVNLSFNINDRFFVGASVGAYDINFNRESFYEELGSDGTPYDFSNWYITDGTGYDVKLGFICRPIENSPFRFGFSVHSPIWYKMTDTNGSTLYLNDYYLSQVNYDPFDYDYRTPWTFGGSLGYTVGNYFAIGAEYEFQDLSSAHYSIDGHETNYLRQANQYIRENLKGQHTFKIGMEVKPVNSFSIRAGYNFVSSPFKNNAYKYLAYDSPLTETDYTNWKATNRFTFGLGYRYKGGYIDLAYQLSSTKGDFYAFYDNSDDYGQIKPTEIKNDRSQVMCTIGFRF